MKTRHQHAKKLFLVFLSGFITIIALLTASPFVKAQPISHGDLSHPEQFKGQKLSWLAPNPGYTPDEVVRFQLEALSRNNVPYDDAGVELVFRFVSPSNRERTGPLPRFTRIVYNPMYRSLVNHQLAHYGELLLDGDKAHQLVVLTDSDGERVSYVFSLSLQHGGKYDRCWMTDSVLLLPGLHDI